MIPSVNLSCSATVEVESLFLPYRMPLNAKDVLGALAPFLGSDCCHLFSS